ncbi:GntR family transcriptional regulator, partial [Desulfovibrio desulfuricans]|nr:GntR family transcriptional regulator [Desulfovibrio desulfuricans]
MRYLDRVCEGIHPQKDIEFEWYTGREVSYLYMQTAGYLLQDIAENCYPNGQLLNLEQLAKRYAVSLRTMRRTMK